jgi:hypothetical protein
VQSLPGLVEKVWSKKVLELSSVLGLSVSGGKAHGRIGLLFGINAPPVCRARLAGGHRGTVVRGNLRPGCDSIWFWSFPTALPFAVQIEVPFC